MFKQNNHRLVLEKKPEGISMEIGEMDADKKLFTIKNVLSILAKKGKI